MPLALFLGVFTIATGDLTLLLFLLGSLFLGLIDYFLFDALIDKLTWKFFWGRFYPNDYYASNESHDAIKAYEKNPTEANRLAIEKQLKQ